MRWVAVLALVLLAGCSVCDLSHDLEIVSGSDRVPVGSEISLALDSEGFTAGPGNCQGSWYVDGVAFGTALIGTINNCGLYTAPPTPPDHEVLIEGMKYPKGECSDCCPYGSKRVRVVMP